jgi:type II secretion system protein J
MKSNFTKTGFTLVEILVAMAIVVTIVSMVYGSYFATARSAETYRLKMTASEQARTTLQQMSQVVRCAYAPAMEEPCCTPRGSREKQKATTQTIDYFEGDNDARTGRILHLVTTARIAPGRLRAAGLFDVVYMFDPTVVTLFVARSRFVETQNERQQNGYRNWRPLLENVEDVDLAFFDGSEWLAKWDFRQEQRLPAAVRIRLACRDAKGRLSAYGSVVDIGCQRNPKGKTISGTAM